MKTKVLGSILTLSVATTGVVVGSGSAKAAIMNGDTFGMAGNLYFTSAQIDFVGPPPVANPIPKTPNQEGYFTIFRGEGAFLDGVFNPPSTGSPRASFIKDLADPAICGGGGCAIDPAGPIVDPDVPGENDPPPFGPVLNDFIVFNNIGNGGNLNFTIDLETVTRITPAGGATPLTEVTYELTGTLTDLTTGETFDAVGSVTPNIGSGVLTADGTRFVKDLTFGELDPFTFQGRNTIGYQMDWVVRRDVPEPMTGIGAIIAFGLGSLFIKKRQEKEIKS
jgi:hypothetical protein